MCVQESEKMESGSDIVACVCAWTICDEISVYDTFLIYGNLHIFSTLHKTDPKLCVNERVYAHLCLHSSSQRLDSGSSTHVCTVFFLFSHEQNNLSVFSFPLHFKLFF